EYIEYSDVLHFLPVSAVAHQIFLHVVHFPLQVSSLSDSLPLQTLPLLRSANIPDAKSSSHTAETHQKRADSNAMGYEISFYHFFFFFYWSLASLFLRLPCFHLFYFSKL